MVVGDGPGNVTIGGEQSGGGDQEEGVPFQVLCSEGRAVQLLLVLETPAQIAGEDLERWWRLRLPRRRKRDSLRLRRVGGLCRSGPAQHQCGDRRQRRCHVKYPGCAGHFPPDACCSALGCQRRPSRPSSFCTPGSGAGKINQARESRLAPCGTPLLPNFYLVVYLASFSKNRQIDSIPRWKFGMWNFSLGACRLSSGRPKPIITLGILRTSWKSVTMGMDPPERMKTVSFLKMSCMASVAALMYLLSVETTQAGPLLQTFIFVSIPLGVSFFTYAV